MPSVPTGAQPPGAADTRASPFNAATTGSVSDTKQGFGQIDQLNETYGADGTLLTLCEHSKTTDVKIVSDILLSQVENLSKTDKNYQGNLEIAGGSLEKIRFVRGASYLSNMSDIVQKQEKELANQGFRLDKLTDLEEENQMLKEKI